MILIRFFELIQATIPDSLRLIYQILGQDRFLEDFLNLNIFLF